VLFPQRLVLPLLPAFPFVLLCLRLRLASRGQTEQSFVLEALQLLLFDFLQQLLLLLLLLPLLLLLLLETPRLRLLLWLLVWLLLWLLLRFLQWLLALQLPQLLPLLPLLMPLLPLLPLLLPFLFELRLVSLQWLSLRLRHFLELAPFPSPLELRFPH